MLLLNFSHPQTPAQLAQQAAQLDGAPPDVHDVPAQFDQARPFAGQVADLLDAAGLSAAAWQTTPLLIMPPAYAPIAATLIAELHGRMGYFPAIVRSRPVAGSTPPQFEVAEIINLQAVRDAARNRR
ncbi:CRISPR-associated protein Csx15 [Promineifilum sp.]|uniref:CRISPR-associated protein Csx15 n=1 Tax=Promineifilum sp. TaxID=2664178 RepID=UPI0035AE9602